MLFASFSREISFNRGSVMRDMINEHGNEPIRVHTDGDAGPYLIIEPAQAADVRAVLDKGGIGYSIDSDAIRVDGHPAGTLFNLGHGADIQEIQRLLDEVE